MTENAESAVANPQLNVLADKPTCMCDIQIAFSSTPFIITDKSLLIDSLKENASPRKPVFTQK